MLLLCRGMTDLSHRVKSFYQKRLLPAEMVSSPALHPPSHQYQALHEPWSGTAANVVAYFFSCQ